MTETMMTTLMQQLKAKMAQKAEHGADAGGDGDGAGGRRPVAVPTSKEKVAKKMKVTVAQVVEVKKAKTGRPPKGEVAMTKTERQRAWRARVRARSS